MNSNSVDTIRTVALTMMIAIHVSIRGMTQLHPDWWIANAWDSVSRVCVPLFFMLSGALLLGKSEPVSIFIKKRLTRIAAPFLFWSACYVIFKINIENNNDGNGFVTQLLSGGVYFHLWFIYALIALYIATPMLRVFFQGASKGTLYFTLGAAFLGSSIIPFLQKLSLFPYLALTVDPIVKFGFFFVLGAALKDTDNKRLAPACTVIFISLTAITFFATHHYSEKQGKLNEIFYGYLSPNIVVMSLCSFIVLSRLGELIGDRKVILLKEISACSYGAYLAHMMAMKIILRSPFGAYLSFSDSALWYSIPLLVLGVLILSVGSISILRRIPYIGRLCG